MGKNLSALALASMLILSGCDRLGISNPFFEKEVSCGSEEAKEILVKLIRDNVEGETVKLLTMTHSKNRHSPTSAYRISAA